MSKIAIVYWSGTGNTEIMANCIAEGVKAAGGEVEMIDPASFNAQSFSGYNAVAFGCSAMGAEQLEETEFEPMFESIEGSLMGKKIALFGSYGWGDGQWMRDWYKRCDDDGATLIEDSGLMAHETPDADVEASCRALGGKLAAC